MIIVFTGNSYVGQCSCSFNTGSFKCVYTNLLASALGDQQEIVVFDPTVPAGHGSITWKAFL